MLSCQLGRSTQTCKHLLSVPKISFALTKIVKQGLLSFITSFPLNIPNTKNRVDPGIKSKVVELNRKILSRGLLRAYTEFTRKTRCVSLDWVRIIYILSILIRSKCFQNFGCQDRIEIIYSNVILIYPLEHTKKENSVTGGLRKHSGDLIT